MRVRSGAVLRAWRPAAAAVVCAGVLAGCGEDDVGAVPAPPTDSMTGCLRTAGYDLERRSSTTLSVREDAGDGTGTVVRLPNAEGARDLAANMSADGGRAIGTRVVIYRGKVSGAMRADVQRCAVENPDNQPPDV